MPYADTPEGREKRRLAKERERGKQRRQIMTPEQKARAAELLRARRAKMTDARREAHNRYQREYQRKRRETSPEDAPWREAKREQQRASYARQTPQRRAEVQARKYRLRVGRSGGSYGTSTPGPLVPFPLCAAPTPERDLLVRLLAAVKPCEDREDIVGEAALLILEGKPFAEALREARRRVGRDAGFLRHSTRPIDECYFL